uniref:SPNS lysolipid transporter 3, sphingosine-1-phosphate (putative) n=1 Tax=Equus caballus TaxID=9796 RepID=A0A3Q2HBM9_HORSE
MCLQSALVPGQRLRAGEAGGMSVECREPGPEGPQDWSAGPGGHAWASGSGRCPRSTTPAPWSLPRWRAIVAAAVLCYINLLNYMNWFIIAGVLLDVQKFFQISDSNAGLLQTVFISCLLLSAPVFGYLGDRHSRKATLSFGILLWSGAGLSGSFVSPRYSWLFFLSRGVVGTGTASYSTIAPTILGDLFVRDQRTRVLAIFYIFIPVGSGLGYVLGSAVTELTGNWHWALRVMPCLEAVALILLIVLVPDPPRGAAEKQGAMAMGGQRSSWCEDVRYLGRNWSFVWSTLGVTAMAFVTGALGFWVPKFLFEARVVHGLQPPCLQEPCSSQDSLIFGALTVVTGIVGVVLGAEVSRSYKRVNPRAEPLICASSLLAAAPCLYLALVLAPITFPFSYIGKLRPRDSNRQNSNSAPETPRCSWPLGSCFCPVTGQWLLTSCCPWWCPGAGGQQRHFRSRWATSWETLAAPTSLDFSPAPCGPGAPTPTCSAFSVFSRASCAAPLSSPWGAAAFC